MAEKKQHKIISSETGEQVAQPHKTGGAAVKQAPATGNSAGLRVGAGVLWVMALGMEVLGVLILLGKVSFHFMPSLWQLIAVLVIDLVFVIIGAQLWKKANHIHPASEKNAFTF